jgi:hypothetical protein
MTISKEKIRKAIHKVLKDKVLGLDEISNKVLKTAKE